MLKKIKQLITLTAIAAALIFPVAAVATAGAQAPLQTESPDIQGSLQTGSCTDTTATDCATAESGTSVNTVVATVINIFSWVVGVVSVIMIIVGGFQYVTSGGDSNKVGTAKNTILYAIVGLVIVAFAQIIVQFVLDKIVTPA